MKKLEKIKLQDAVVLENREMKTIFGGSGGNCPSGQFSCTCNGKDYGCVSSTSECWNKC